MKDKYFLLNGRSYPDTVSPGPLQTQSADGVNHFSQPPGRDRHHPSRGTWRCCASPTWDVSEYQTLASAGYPDAGDRLQRQAAGATRPATTCTTRPTSITLGGGESLDVILDACAVRGPAADLQLHDTDGCGHVLPVHPPTSTICQNDAGKTSVA